MKLLVKPIVRAMGPSSFAKRLTGGKFQKGWNHLRFEAASFAAVGTQQLLCRAGIAGV